MNKVVPVGMGNTGAHFKILAEQMASTQYIREFVINMIEANASQGLITYDPIKGTDKLVFADNGEGMTAYELEEYIGRLSSGKKTIGVGHNFGIGAKIASASRNKLGVTYSSWVDASDPGEDGNRVIFGYDDHSDEYGLVEFTSGLTVDAPEVTKSEFRRFFPGNVRNEVVRGTFLRLDGNSVSQDTSEQPADFVGVKAGTRDDLSRSWIHNALTWRFFEFPDSFSLRVSQRDNGTGKTHPNSGMKPWLNANAVDSGVVKLHQAGGKANWWLMPEKGKSDPRYNVKRGFGYLYSTPRHGFSEVYEPTVNLSLLRGFGLPMLATRLVILIEADGAEPDMKRLYLERDGGRLDVEDFQLEFIDNMPDRLRTADSSALSERSTKVTPENIKRWLNSANTELPFPERIIEASMGFRAAEAASGVSPEEFQRDPSVEASGERTGSDNTGSGNADRERRGRTAGEGRRASRRVASPVEDMTVLIVGQDVFGEEFIDRAAEWSNVTSTLTINRDYYLFQTLLSNLSNKHLQSEDVLKELEKAVVCRVAFCISSLRALQKRSGLDAAAFRDATSKEALTAAVELGRMDILNDVKKNIGRLTKAYQNV